MNTKLFILAVFVLMGLLYGILPKTGLAKKMKMNERMFYIMNIVGITFGTLGMIISVLYPGLILEKHYFELILLPVLFVFVYTAIIGKVSGGEELYDEKQNLNMTQAAAVTWPASIVAVFFLYAMYREGIFTGLVFFPLFLYFSFTFYSASSLYFFRKN